MTCRYEHPTRENLAARDLQRLYRRLDRLAQRRISVLLDKKIRKAEAELKFLRQMAAFHAQIDDLSRRLRALCDKHDEDPNSVTIADWDDIARGSECKVLYIVGSIVKVPRSLWPDQSLYPNMIALRKMQMAAERDQQARELAQAAEKLRKLEPLIELYKRSLADGEESVSWEEWYDAVEGTDALEGNADLAMMVRRAHERGRPAVYLEAGEREDSADVSEESDDEREHLERLQ